jgi:hypothetical protein
MRQYIDTARYHAVLKPYSFQGTEWPQDRAYFDTSQVRAPYKRGFYQDNTLQGEASTTIPTWMLVIGGFVGGFFLAKATIK